MVGAEHDRSLILRVALEFGARLGDQNLIEAVIAQACDPIILKHPRIYPIIIAYSIMKVLPIDDPSISVSALGTAADKLISLNDAFGPLDRFNDAIAIIGTQLALVLISTTSPFDLRATESHLLDTAESNLRNVMQHEDPTVVITAAQKLIQLVRNSSSPKRKFLYLRERYPYTAAVRLLHDWLSLEVMRSHEPCVLEKVFSDLVGDLSKREPNDLPEFRPVRRPSDVRRSRSPVRSPTVPYPPSPSRTVIRRQQRSFSPPNRAFPRLDGSSESQTAHSPSRSSKHTARRSSLAAPSISPASVSVANMSISLHDLRHAFAGTDKQFRLIWKQTHPLVLKYLRQRRC